CPWGGCPGSGPGGRLAVREAGRGRGRRIRDGAASRESAPLRPKYGVHAAPWRLDPRSPGEGRVGHRGAGAQGPRRSPARIPREPGRLRLIREGPRRGVQVQLVGAAVFADLRNEREVFRVLATQMPDRATQGLLERLVVVGPERFLQDFRAGTSARHALTSNSRTASEDGGLEPIQFLPVPAHLSGVHPDPGGSTG